jgi:uncharacterized protein with PIN domain
MAFQRRFGQDNVRAKTMRCSCGGEAKFRSKKNYPFGKKSSAVKSQFYKCPKCNKATFVD